MVTHNWSICVIRVDIDYTPEVMMMLMFLQLLLPALLMSWYTGAPSCKVCIYIHSAADLSRQDAKLRIPGRRQFGDYLRPGQTHVTNKQHTTQHTHNTKHKQHT